MEMPSQFGVAVIGCGYWGMNYLRVFDELSESRLVAVCEQRPERLAEVVRRFPGTIPIDSVSELLSRSDIDAVVVCTEASGHFNLASACLRQGKHVLVEKPLTTTSEDAEKLTDIAEQNGRTLMVGHTFLFNSGVRTAKTFLQTAGQIYYLHARRTNLGPVRTDVNAIWDLATHDIAIFNYLLDSFPEWVTAVGARVLRSQHEDVGFLTLGYPGNILAHIHVSWADPNKARETVIVASERRIVFNDLDGLERIRVFEKGIRTSEEPSTYGEYQLQVREGDILSPHVDGREPLKEQCRHFFECLATGARPISDGRNGCEVLKILEAIDRSVRMNGTQVQVGGNGVHNAFAAA